MENEPRVLVHVMDFAEPRRKVFEAVLDCLHQLGEVRAHKKSGNFIEADLEFSVERGRPSLRATFESGVGRTSVKLEITNGSSWDLQKQSPLVPEVERIESFFAGQSLRRFAPPVY